MHSADEEALAKENEDFDPPFQPPPPSVCHQLFRAVRQGHKAFNRFMRGIEFEGWCITRLQCASTETGQNILHLAAETGDWRILYTLQNWFTVRHLPVPLSVSIPRKRLPIQRDEYGNTPLHVAAVNDHLDFAVALLKYYNGDRIQDPDSALDKVEITRDVALSEYRMEFCPRLRFLLDRKNDTGLTAAQAGVAANVTVTACLLKKLRKQGVDGVELMEAEESGDDHLDMSWRPMSGRPTPVKPFDPSTGDP